MKLHEFRNKLNEILEKYPNADDFDVIYSSDDEGKSFDLVRYNPSVGNFNVKTKEYKDLSYDIKRTKVNTICIN